MKHSQHLATHGATSAFAGTDYCAQRASLEAKIKWSKEYSARINRFDFKALSSEVSLGAWSEAVGDNVGYYDVTVSYPGIRGMYQYRVDAKQIATSADCKITQVSP